MSIHNKGKKPSRALIESTIRTNHSRKGKRAKPHRPDITPMMVFKLRQDGLSFRQISLKLNLDWGCVKQRFEVEFNGGSTKVTKVIVELKENNL